ncbi:MAG: hypothetical protein AAF081_02880 [Actinomycetota bacterium]
MDTISTIIIRLLAVVGAATVLAGAAATAKKRSIIRRFRGATPDEARARIVEYATKRTGDAEKAERIADRMIARLQARGVLADDTMAA